MRNGRKGESERKTLTLIKEKKKTRERERITMVVIYDRFVFFSVEKFFIPLLYSCLNILVQRSCASTSERASERMRLRVCMCVCACVCSRDCFVYLCAHERG